jgi:transketolase
MTSYEQAVHTKAVQIARLSVEMTTAAGSGHPSTALSLAHLTAVLMYDHMRWNPADPWDGGADRLVLSEGHAVPIVYAAYADIGGVIGTRKQPRAMTRQDALSLRAIDSPIDGHPHPAAGFPFFDAATGSLGQGLSVAAGLGVAASIDRSDRIIYCIIGDGEAREGQIWEAADFIVDQALTNVVAIFNCNALAQSDYVSPQQSPDALVRKLEAYGFVVRNIDGHDPAQIKAALNELNVVRNGNRPLAIVARTVKGWGSVSEQGAGKHGTPVKKDKLEAILKELDQTLLELTDGKAGAKLKIHTPQARPAAAGGPIRIASFNEGMEALGLLKDVQAGKPLAPRRAYGVALVMLGKADPRIVALDADVKNSTFAEWFAKRIPERFVECKIAEQNMISAAAGLAAAGKIPFCSTFAKFVMRGYDQLEMAIISGANIKVTGSHAGVTLAADGPSQMSLPDAAFFRSFCHATNFNGGPAVRYFFPADAVSCYRLVELMANLDGCCYLRTLRADLPLLYKVDDTGFEVGGFRVLREGTDACLVAGGYMVHECLKAADELAKGGKKATVIDAYSMPLKAKELLEVARRSGGKIVVVEDNYTGGLDAEIAMAIAGEGGGLTLKSLHVARVPKSGREPDDVLKYLDLDVKSILKAV